MAWCGTPPSVSDWFLAWNGSVIQGALLILMLACVSLTKRPRPFLLGWLALVVAFVSPLCALTAALFGARVLHHLLLVLVAAPLLALAFPARRASGPAAPAIAFVLVMWGWHWPPAYLSAYDSVTVYWAMQLSLFASGMWFWRAATAPTADAIPTLASIGAVSGAMGLLGGLLTFAAQPLYLPHILTTEAFGLTALEDQQLGGLLMWVPGMVPFAIAGILLARRRLAGLEADATR